MVKRQLLLRYDCTILVESTVDFFLLRHQHSLDAVPACIHVLASPICSVLHSAVLVVYLYYTPHYELMLGFDLLIDVIDA
jgi:hypothetical protein